MSSEALAGLKVVEFTQGMAGPWIGRMLAWAGAEVIRIESHQVPGVVRLYVSPASTDRKIEPEMSPWFTDWDAGKLFVTLNRGGRVLVPISESVGANTFPIVDRGETAAARNRLHSQNPRSTTDL